MRTTMLMLIALTATGVRARGPSVGPQQPTCRHLSERDARVLVYLIPAAFEVRTKGKDVALMREPGVETATAPDMYAFRVDGAPNPNGSSLLGHYGVDRCTGDVKDLDLGERVTSATLRGVQRILMRP
jgi:hypothetical protein